ncbi:hypothetical protein B7494_g7457 [Chlorociboria aeruginascens]|nr:hypothetical protein B7494_g7457 [Chlorociboria aeruginascens]
MSPSLSTTYSNSDDEDTHPTSASSVSPSEPYPNHNDIAVIGYACRAPGGNDSPAELWEFLLKKGDASGDIPEMRWEPYKNRHPGNTKTLAETTSKGYFLDNLENFDASFFGISPREAELIDPQQRIAVEVAWEALENAGIPAHSLAGTDAAVYMGVGSDDYSRLLLEDLPNVEAWMGVGTAFCGVPNRISYLFDLMGPSVALDAACASSLVAIHQGRQALLAGETRLVIAGGVNALAGPGLTRVLDKAGAISRDGKCRSFDDAAAGYGRGEGSGIVILKRLSDAIDDEDRVLAVLKGSAVGADGRTNGIMAPNSDAQVKVARQALKEAGLSGESIGYVEAHATSTPLGDPAECAAIASVYGHGSRKSEDDPCFIGSIKSNIGHLEAGAGVMGFIKAVMTVNNALIAPQANLVKPNTKIDWEKSMLKTVTEPTVWTSKGKIRRAAIASYGYGGTVSHAVIEAAPVSHISHRRMLGARLSVDAPFMLVLSAPQESRIKDIAITLASWLETSESHTESVALTLAAHRHHHKFRAAIVASTKVESIQLLKDLAGGNTSKDILSGRVPPKGTQDGSVWVFSGHGAQWKDMGLSLLDHEPVFRDTINEIEPLIQAQMGFSAIDSLRTGDFDTVDKIQVLTYAMQVGLAAVLNAKGLTPKAIVGHSLGEIAANVVAGTLTVEEGALICCIRARLYKGMNSEGAMCLVNMPMKEAAERLESVSDVVVAIDASTGSCVISGNVKPVEDISARWTAEGYKVQRVKSTVAFHSPLLAPLEAPLVQGLRGRLSPSPAKVPLYSTTLEDCRSEVPRDIEYWVRNMINPVLLTSTITEATRDGYRTFLEVSTHPIVSHSITETLMDIGIADAVVIPTMLRNKDSQKCLLSAIGKLHCNGEEVSFNRTFTGRFLSEVPGTVWNHQPYWRQVSDAAVGRNVGHDVNEHILLGSRTQVNGTKTTIWQTYLDPQVKPFPGSHFLHGAEIVPAAVLLNTFLAAAPGQALKNVSLRVPVVVGPPREVQIMHENGQMLISSRLVDSGSSTKSTDNSWLTNTKSQTAEAIDLRSLGIIDISQLKQQCTKRLPDTFSIDYLAKVGVSDMGFPWKVTEHWESETEMLAMVDTDPDNEKLTLSSTSWASILDAATSVSSTIFYKDPLLRMPTAIGKVTVAPAIQTPKKVCIYVQKAAEDFAADILILDDRGSIVVKIQNLKFAGIEGTAGPSQGELVYKMAWPPAQLSEEPLQIRKVILVGEESQLLQSYRDQLGALGLEHEVLSELVDNAEIAINTVVVFVANIATATEDVYAVSEQNSQRLLDTIKRLAKTQRHANLFCITKDVSRAGSNEALSQSSLHGLARIVQSEEPDIFKGLIDVEDQLFPMQALKYVQGVDIIRIQDTVARNARLRPFTKEQSDSSSSFQVRPQGTYLITGGLGALGLQVARYLASQGAKRLVLVSRTQLPPRKSWVEGDLCTSTIHNLEELGVSVYAVSVDMCASNASAKLHEVLDNLHLPPVLGVVHAAGTLANQTVLETTADAFNSVISPKIKGAMALHKLFPPKSLDFMVLFSSCGQLLGFPGQAAYASGNAFLDAVATHRQALGDNTISMLWTSWRGLGMAASTRYIDAELAARGITDITHEEAFVAWEQIFKSGSDHGVVLHTLTIEADEPSPHPVLNDIIVRRSASTSAPTGGEIAVNADSLSGDDLQTALTKAIIGCVASTLSLSTADVDPHCPLSELGMDSVMTVGLRTKLQQALKVKVGPTLIWNCPTVNHLVQHFVKEKSS